MVANPKQPSSSSRTPQPDGLLRRKHGGDDGSDDDKSTQGSSSSGGGSNNSSPTSSHSLPPATVTHTQVQTQTQTQVQTQSPSTTTVINAAPPPATTGTTLSNNINNINDASDPSNPVSTSSTSSGGSSGSSASPSSSSSTASFTFNNPQNATACSSLTLSWNFAGSSQATMTLEVEPVHNTANITRILTTNASTSSKSYIWAVVNVDQGWYIAKGFDTNHSLGLSATSSPFWVTDGSNTSCLSAASTSGDSGQPSPTDHSSHAHDDGKLGPDQIVAVVLGAAAAVLLFVGGFVGYKVWKQRRDNPKPPGPTKGTRLPSMLY